MKRKEEVIKHYLKLDYKYKKEGRSNKTPFSLPKKIKHYLKLVPILMSLLMYRIIDGMYCDNQCLPNYK